MNDFHHIANKLRVPILFMGFKSTLATERESSCLNFILKSYPQKA